MRYYQVHPETSAVREATEHDMDGSEIGYANDQFSFALGSGLAPTVVINDWFGSQPFAARVRCVAAAADAMWAACNA